MSLISALSNTGSNYEDLKYYDTALVYYRKALVLAQHSKYRMHENTLLLNLASLYMHTLQTDSMKYYNEKALALSSELDLPENELKANRGMANYFALKNNLSEAHKYITRAMDLSEKNSSREGYALNLGTLSVILVAMHRMKESFRTGETAGAIHF